MQISIFGSGYVELVRAAVFSEVRHQVTCMDIDPARIEGFRAVTYPLVVRNKTEQNLEDVIKPPSSGYAKNEFNASCSV